MEQIVNSSYIPKDGVWGFRNELVNLRYVVSIYCTKQLEPGSGNGDPIIGFRINGGGSTQWHYPQTEEGINMRDNDFIKISEKINN